MNGVFRSLLQNKNKISLRSHKGCRKCLINWKFQFYDLLSHRTYLITERSSNIHKNMKWRSDWKIGKNFHGVFFEKKKRDCDVVSEFTESKFHVDGKVQTWGILMMTPSPLLLWLKEVPRTADWIQKDEKRMQFPLSCSSPCMVVIHPNPIASDSKVDLIDSGHFLSLTLMCLLEKKKEWACCRLYTFSTLIVLFSVEWSIVFLFLGV